MFPPGLRPHWSVCFAVADCHATSPRRVSSARPSLAEPMDMPIGRFAAIVDPQGAAFTVMQMAS